MFEDTVVRMENAYSKLIDVLVEYGAGEYGAQVADLYIQEKIVKLDVNIGSYRFCHGSALDSAVIERAIQRALQTKMD